MPCITSALLKIIFLPIWINGIFPEFLSFRAVGKEISRNSASSFIPFNCLVSFETFVITAIALILSSDFVPIVTNVVILSYLYALFIY